MEEKLTEKRKEKKFIQGFVCGALIFCILTAVVCFAVYKVAEAKSKESVITGLIERYFMDPVSEEQLEDGKYYGMIAALGDEYSKYISTDEYEEFLEGANSTFKGIGVVLVKDEENDSILVYDVYEDSPANDAGIESGDEILSVNGESVSGKALEEVTEMIKSDENLVRLTVKRFSDKETVEVEMVPREIDHVTVAGFLNADRTGYIRISKFGEDTANQFEKIYNELKEQNVKKLIIDLRGNVGGLFQSAVDCLNVFMPKGLLVYTEDKQGNRREFYSECEDPISIPLAVLVDSSTASASEIFCGAVRDTGVGILVGEKTFGKGIVQNTYVLEDGSAVKLTVKKYFTPDGINFHGEGIEPDVEAPLEKGKKITADENDDTFMAAVNELGKEG
ncbi:MAG: S41 family peptidase [Lachnospiraceae bacterium]|jgi:carboxyl-terminal processing protease